MVNAKRAGRRRSERGATVFVVVLAVTMLTGVGLFAAHSATVVDQAAGYARLARQTGYLAEYGTLTMAAELGTGAGSRYLEEAMKKDVGTDPDDVKRTCPGVLPLQTEYPTEHFDCLLVRSGRLGQRFADVANDEPLLIDQSGNTRDRLGYAPTAATGVLGEFVVELTDFVQAPPQPGSSQIPTRVTTTTAAILRPPGDACTQGTATLTGRQSVRSHLIVPYTSSSGTAMTP